MKIKNKNFKVSINCFQEIPCNPCETACPVNAIKIGDVIIQLPVINEQQCIGCGICAIQCPGMAILLVNESENIVGFPYEYLPLPIVGETVTVLDKVGNDIGEGQVIDIKQPNINDPTKLVYVSVNRNILLDVNSMKGVL